MTVYLSKTQFRAAMSTSNLEPITDWKSEMAIPRNIDRLMINNATCKGDLMMLNN